MKKLIGIIFVFSTVIFAQTNQFYITDDRLKNVGPFVPTVDQIDSAKHSKESRPEENDPEGNWGPASEGFRLSIRLEKQLFTNGEPITASVLLRNISDNPLKYFDGTTKDYLQIFPSRDGQKLYRNDEARPGMTFMESIKYIKAGIQWTSIVGPGTQRKFIVELTNVFDCSTNGEYKVQARQDIMTIEALSFTNKVEMDNAVARKIVTYTNVVSGTATFYITNSAVK